MQPVNELRMRARWKLGGALKAAERTPEGGDQKTTTTPVSSGFWKWTKQTLGLEAPTVVEAQRIATMPDTELTKAYDLARNEARLLHYSELIVIARPYWYKGDRAGQGSQRGAACSDRRRLNGVGQRRNGRRAAGCFWRGSGSFRRGSTATRRGSRVTKLRS